MGLNDNSMTEVTTSHQQTLSDTQNDTLDKIIPHYQLGMNNIPNSHHESNNPINTHGSKIFTPTMQTDMTQIAENCPPCPPWAYQLINNVQEIN